MPKEKLPAVLAKIIKDNPELLGHEGEGASSNNFPAGAIVSFDLSSKCPIGWSSFQEGNSRVIIGAATGDGYAPGIENNEALQPLVQYKYRAHGGVETVTLNKGQMPKHNHQITTSHRAGKSIHDGLGGSGAEYGINKNYDKPVGITDSGWGQMPNVISPSGNNQAHNNMPPYIALYFCKKD